MPKNESKAESSKLDNTNIGKVTTFSTPKQIADQFEMTDKAKATVRETREAISKILKGEDKRLLIIIGPCSLHNPTLAIEYAKNLKVLRDKYEDNLLIVMRTYFEKPRTTVGWKGLINQPDGPNGSFNVEKGLRAARQLLVEINNLGLGCGTEYLDLFTPQYLSDAISWAAIGARTTESQPHRELVSGIACAVGFKNNTSGDVTVAANSILSSKDGHRYLSTDENGNTVLVESKGNPDCHIILRGGKQPDGTLVKNYKPADVNDAIRKLKDRNRVMVDCSHGNSEKNHEKQFKVLEEVADYIIDDTDGAKYIGLMIESNIIEGSQTKTD